jgi:phage tail-like protein
MPSTPTTALSSLWYTSLVPITPRAEPLRSANFLVEIDGIMRTRFISVNGLESDVDIIEEREGTDPRHSRKLPGPTHTQNLVLRWPTDDDRELNDWHQRVVDGQVDRRNGSIILLDDAGTPRIRWNFVSAWPAKWNGPSFDAEGDEIAIETIELAHDGISLA